MSDVVSGLTVNRWKRYGKDRLYVTAAGETKIGFWDLLTGEGHPESPEHALALEAAVAVWKAEQDAPIQPSPTGTPEQVVPLLAVTQDIATEPPSATKGPSVPGDVLPDIDQVVETVLDVC